MFFLVFDVVKFVVLTFSLIFDLSSTPLKIIIELRTKHKWNLTFNNTYLEHTESYLSKFNSTVWSKILKQMTRERELLTLFANKTKNLRKPITWYTLTAITNELKCSQKPVLALLKLPHTSSLKPYSSNFNSVIVKTHFQRLTTISFFNKTQIKYFSIIKPKIQTIFFSFFAAKHIRYIIANNNN